MIWGNAQKCTVLQQSSLTAYIDLTDVFRCKACSALGNAIIKTRTWKPNGEKILKEWIWAEAVALPPEHFLVLSRQELTNRVEFIFGRHVADTHCNHCVATFCFLLTPAVPSCWASSNIFVHFVSFALLFETPFCSEYFPTTGQKTLQTPQPQIKVPFKLFT